MTISDPKVGGWADHEVLTHGQMNAIRTELLKAVDGAGGGTYNLTAPLTFDGDEVRIDWTLRLRSGADFFVDSGAQFGVSTGGTFDVNGTWTFDGDGSFNADNTFSGTGTTTFASSHPVTIEDVDDWTLDGQSQTRFLLLVPIGYAFTGSPLQPTWETHPAFDGPYWSNSINGSNSVIYFPVPVSGGDVITSLDIFVIGGQGGGHGGTDPSNKIRARLFETFLSGGATSIASLEDPATGAAYDAAHSFNLASIGSPFPLTTSLSKTYCLEIRGENGGTAYANANVIYGISVTTERSRVFSNLFGS
jgi:hypothetical protein